MLQEIQALGGPGGVPAASSAPQHSQLLVIDDPVAVSSYSRSVAPGSFTAPQPAAAPSSLPRAVVMLAIFSLDTLFIETLSRLRPCLRLIPLVSAVYMRSLSG